MKHPSPAAQTTTAVPASAARINPIRQAAHYLPIILAALAAASAVQASEPFKTAGHGQQDQSGYAYGSDASNANVHSPGRTIDTALLTATPLLASHLARAAAIQLVLSDVLPRRKCSGNVAPNTQREALLRTELRQQLAAVRIYAQREHLASRALVFKSVEILATQYPHNTETPSAAAIYE